MPIIQPTPIDQLPQPPNPADRSSFNSLAYPFTAAMLPLTVQINKAVSDMYNNAREAEAKAGEAEGSAAAAAGSAAAANTAKTGAETAKAGAETARTGAQSSATAAANSATAANTARASAEAARDAAAQSATDAAQSAADAAGVVQGNFGLAIHAATAKAAPADADELAVTDSQAGWTLRKLTWDNLKAAIWAAFKAIATGGNAKDTLGLGTAATRNVGTGSGNVMGVGAFGLGGLYINANIATGSYIGRYSPEALPVGYPASWYPYGSILSMYHGYTGASAEIVIPHRLDGGIKFRSGRGANFIDILHTDNILSTTGQSTEYPMTQKAVTDALDTKANTSTQVIAGTGLSGGGNLSASRTLSVNYGTTAGTAAQGNDSRITGAAQKSANLSDLASAGAARQNLGLGTAATRDVGTASGNVMEVGAFGLGGHYGNTNITTGSYIGAYTPTSLPVGYPAGWYGYGSILSMRHGHSGTHAEIVIPHRLDGGIKFRSGRGANFIDILHTDNILSTTGQSTQYPMTQKATTDALNTKVGLTGNQTIAGTKTFSSFPVTPSAAPTANYQVANKKYVDDNAIGVGQTWQNPSRAVGTTYTNSTGRPIMVGVRLTSSVNSRFYVGSLEMARGSAQHAIAAWAVIPPGATYRADGAIDSWVELR